MSTVSKTILSIVFSFILLITSAQRPKTVATKPATVQKSKSQQLICKLGSYTDSATVFTEEAQQLVNLPLRVTDDRQNPYTILSYQLLYKRQGVTENEETGKVTPVTTTISDVFTTTPLPDIWRRTLTEQLKPGEELYFFDIVVKDTQGRLIFAPDLRIKIK